MKNVKTVTTNNAKKQYWEEKETKLIQQEACMQVVNLFPEMKQQIIDGFGGAITEAAVVTADRLSGEGRQEILDSCFGQEGLRYNLARIHMNSCDFALGNYTYVEEGDPDLSTFSISHDQKQLIPFMKDAQKTAEGTLAFLSSPWSPPAYMKTNGEMNHGGKLKEEFAPLWAEYYVRYIKAYEQEGIPISYITVQNEPMAVQTWDSCIYEAEEEGRFVKHYLAPALSNAGLGHVEIFVWDHNKEAVYERTRDTFAVEGVREAVSGVAVHWYTGDHFDAVRAVKKAFPEKKVFFTEGCVEYSRFADSGEQEKAEMYAHDILGNLKAGTEAFFDWNLLLDKDGGPNHVGNFCAAPIMCREDGKAKKRLAYYYIGHFSRYIKRGAVQIMTSTFTDKLETAAFINPDGERVAILLNRTGEDIEVSLKEEGIGTNTIIEARSIATIRYYA